MDNSLLVGVLHGMADRHEKLQPLLQNGNLTPQNVDEFLRSNIADQLDMTRISKYVLRNYMAQMAIDKADI